MCAPEDYLHSGGGWSSQNSMRPHEVHPHRAVEEVCVTSGRSGDPSVIATPNSLAPHATPSGPCKNAGGYLPRTKDQHLSLEDQEDIPVAVIVDDACPPPD